MRGLTTVALLLMFSLALPVQAEIRAYSDRTRGAVNAPFLLTVEATQPSAGTLDTKPLETAFKILGSRRSSLSSFKNGGNQITQRWLITLAPRQSGLLTIPALHAGGEATQPFLFEALSEGASTQTPSLRLESSIDLPITYQRTAITLAVRLYYLADLTHAEISEPLIDDVRTYPLGEQNHFKEQRSGETYRVIEQRYLLLPEHAGRFELPALHFSGLDASGNNIDTQSQPLPFEALSLPAQAAGSQIATTDVRLNERWLYGNQEIHPSKINSMQVGEQLTREVTLQVHNLPADWLPDLRHETTPGVRAKASLPELRENLNNGVLVSTRTQRFDYLLIEAGEQRVAPISIRWWDAAREQLDISQLQGVTLAIAPFTPGSPEPTAITAQTPPTTLTPPGTPTEAAKPPSPPSAAEVSWTAWLWAVVALICAAGWSLTHARNQRQQLQNEQLERQIKLLRSQDATQRALRKEQEAFAKLNHACRYADPRTVYDALITWAQLFWPQHSITELREIDQLAEAPTLTYLLRDLDARLREGDLDDPWYGDLALKQIARIRNQRFRATERPVPHSIANSAEENQNSGVAV